ARRRPRSAEETLGTCPGIGMARAPGACEAEARSEEDSDAGASSTTSDAAYARSPQAPGGFRRRGGVSVVAAPRRCSRNGLRRGASHPAPRRSKRRPSQYPDRLLGGGVAVLRSLRRGAAESARRCRRTACLYVANPV